MCEHVLTRSVRDSAAMLDATHAPLASAPYFAPPPVRSFLKEVGAPVGPLRIAFHTSPAMPSSVHDDCVEAVRTAATLCEDLGHHVEEVSPVHDAPRLASAFFSIVCTHTSSGVRQLEGLMGMKATPKDFETSTWLLSMLGESDQRR